MSTYIININMESNVYKRQYEQNSNHWWFEGRKFIIKSILANFLKNKKKRILDYGCGVGINLDMLSKFGKVFYYDKSKLAIKYVKKNYRKRKDILRINDLTHFKNKFDLIVLTDVIEHIKNDKGVILKIFNLLKNDGFVLITVPAFQSLYSSKDISLKHYRRYNKAGLFRLLNKNFNTIKFSYFNFILFIPISLFILFFKIVKINFINNVEKKPNFFLNKLAFYLFSFEGFLINRLTFPFGLSIIFFGKKSND